MCQSQARGGRRGPVANKDASSKVSRDKVRGVKEEGCPPVPEFSVAAWTRAASALLDQLQAQASPEHHLSSWGAMPQPQSLEFGGGWELRQARLEASSLVGVVEGNPAAPFELGPVSAAHPRPEPSVFAGSSLRTLSTSTGSENSAHCIQKVIGSLYSENNTQKVPPLQPLGSKRRRSGGGWAFEEREEKRKRVEGLARGLLRRIESELEDGPPGTGPGSGRGSEGVKRAQDGPSLRPTLAAAAVVLLSELEHSHGRSFAAEGPSTPGAVSTHLGKRAQGPRLLRPLRDSLALSGQVDPGRFSADWTLRPKSEGQSFATDRPGATRVVTTHLEKSAHDRGMLSLMPNSLDLCYHLKTGSFSEQSNSRPQDKSNVVPALPVSPTYIHGGDKEAGCNGAWPVVFGVQLVPQEHLL